MFAMVSRVVQIHPLRNNCTRENNYRKQRGHAEEVSVVLYSQKNDLPKKSDAWRENQLERDAPRKGWMKCLEKGSKLRLMHMMCLWMRPLLLLRTMMGHYVQMLTQ
ncbi:hypothetical protein O6H91_09G019100 [Diphasiastrum complanatum]|uniref:Uncharacterized protein n=1 Tax=Diphasiastrum complanatum TaxID=34168 RepID=A0ACC2CLT3_DIPCM|nr:hypothetical protein O6H91_09G019100 [Diphasiastrum complanatum]